MNRALSSDNVKGKVMDKSLEIALVFWTILLVIVIGAAVALLIDWLDLEHTVAGYILIGLAIPLGVLIVVVLRRLRSRG